MLYYLNDKLYGKINVAYTYDDKNNVFKNVLGFDKAKMYLLYELGVNMIGNNNLLTKEHMNRPVTGELVNIKLLMILVIPQVITLFKLFLSNMGQMISYRNRDRFFEYNK